MYITYFLDKFATYVKEHYPTCEFPACEEMVYEFQKTLNDGKEHLQHSEASQAEA